MVEGLLGVRGLFNESKEVFKIQKSFFLKVELAEQREALALRHSHALLVKQSKQILCVQPLRVVMTELIKKKSKGNSLVVGKHSLVSTHYKRKTIAQQRLKNMKNKSYK